MSSYLLISFLVLLGQGVEPRSLFTGLPPFAQLFGNLADSQTVIHLPYFGTLFSAEPKERRPDKTESMIKMV